MMLLMLATGVIVFGLLLLVAAIRPVRSPLSMYELRRRKESGDPEAGEALKREELLSLIEALRIPLAGLLLVALTLLLVGGLGWLEGGIAALVAAVMYARLASLSLFREQARRLYRTREAALLNLVTRHKKKLRFLTGRAAPEPRASAVGSREELFHIISEVGTVLSANDKKLLTHALVFTERRVTDVMTGREAIASIAHTELLGPLVLSDLHKTGHSCFPVIAHDLDHIVGMLDIRQHLTLEAKRSLTAAKAMLPHVFYIRGDQTLDHALAAFVRTRHHLLVVISEEGETLGLLSLRDVLEALFGRPLADEFASDNDLHLVAKRRL